VDPGRVTEDKQLLVLSGFIAEGRILKCPAL